MMSFYAFQFPIIFVSLYIAVFLADDYVLNRNEEMKFLIPHSTDITT